MRVRVSILSALLLPLAACDGASPTPPVDRLRDTSGVDAGLVARIDSALEAVERDPRDPAARRTLARVYQANELWELALSTWEASQALGPEDARAWYHLARVRSELARPLEALEALDRALTLEPDYAPAHVRRGELLLRLGRLAEAEAAFRRATELAPRDAPGWLGLARVYLEQDQPREAIACLEPLVERSPRERFAHGLLARAWRRLGEERRAERALRREERAAVVTVTDPWAAEVRKEAVGVFVEVEQASELLAAGEAERALALLEPLHARHPEDFAVTDLFVRALLLAGRPGDALEVLEAARAQPGAERAGHYRLELSTGEALAALDDLEGALPHLRAAVEDNPAFPEARTALGEALFRLGRLSEAEEHLVFGLAHGEASLRDHLLLGRLQLKRGRVDEALTTLGAATTRYPRSASAWAGLAEAQVEAGRLDEARESLAHVEEQEPDHALLEPLRERLDGGGADG